MMIYNRNYNKIHIVSDIARSYQQQIKQLRDDDLKTSHKIYENPHSRVFHRI